MFGVSNGPPCATSDIRLPPAGASLRINRKLSSTVSLPALLPARRFNYPGGNFRFIQTAASTSRVPWTTKCHSYVGRRARRGCDTENAGSSRRTFRVRDTVKHISKNNYVLTRCILQRDIKAILTQSLYTSDFLAELFALLFTLTFEPPCL